MNFLITLFIAIVSVMVNRRNARTGANAQRPPEDKASAGLSNTRSNQTPLKLLYGTGRVNTNLVYFTSTGDENGYLHMVCVLGEGPINGVVRQDGSIWSTTATQMPSTNPPLVYLDGDLWTETYGDRFYAEFFNGSSDQTVCATLAAISPEWTDCLRYTAYLYVRLKYDEDKYNGVPDITVRYSGLLLNDPAGGLLLDELGGILLDESGNPVWGETYYHVAYSTNPAMAVYDMMTRPSCRGGLGLDTWHDDAPADPRIDFASIITSRTYCDAKGWTADMPIDQDQYFVDNLQLLLNCFRGEIVYSEGEFRIKFRDMNHESTAVMALDEDDIVADGRQSSLTIRPRADLFDLPNTVAANFISADLNYITDTYMFSDDDAISADGDQRTETIDLLGLDIEHVQEMANYYLERIRWGLQASLAVRDRALSLDVMDLITLTHSMPGWTDRHMRVVEVGFDAGRQNILLTLEEEKPELYDAVYDISQLIRYPTSLPKPTDPVPSVIGVSYSEDVYNYRGRSFTRLNISFSRPTSQANMFWKHAEIWRRIGGSGDYEYMTTSTNGYVIDPVEEGELYEVKLRSVSDWGDKEDLETCYSIATRILGKSDLPTDLAGMTAVANGDSVSIYATPVDDPDIDGYEIRLGSAFEGAIFISYNKAPSLRLAGVRPGTHTFWATPVRLGIDGTFIYSANPVSASCTVMIPPGFTLADSWSWDFDGIGTHDNTEHVTHNAQDAVKCSHTSDVLTGAWESPTRDLGSVQKVRVWGEMATDFEASDTTFGGVGAATLTFTELGAVTKTFSEIFEPSAAGQLQVTMQHSLDDATYNDVDRFEVLCAEVNARYIKATVTITDPTLDSNLYLYELPMKAYSGPQ